MAVLRLFFHYLRGTYQLFANGGSFVSIFLISVTFVLLIGLSCNGNSSLESRNDLGDKPGILQHVPTDEFDLGQFTVDELVNIGRGIFTSSFNTKDGAGNSKVRIFGFKSEQEMLFSNFNRISGPDANGCSGCHNLPNPGGGGDSVANVWVLAHKFPNINFDNKDGDFLEELTLKSVGNERGTISMFGSGFIELLAREMTHDLHKLKQFAIEQSSMTQKPVTVRLLTKDVYFGKLTVWPDGLVDASRVEGIDEDLIIKPFGQKGVYTSLREFTLDALEVHHGLQAVERVGLDIDADFDGVSNELTEGDVTALTLFQATLPPPFIQTPQSSLSESYAIRGKELFTNIGCATCHKPFLELMSPIYSEPNRLNPPGTLNVSSSGKDYFVDLVQQLDSNAVQISDDGHYLIYAFTDLKRHDMGPVLANEVLEQRFVESQSWITRKLWGIISEPPFLHHGRATLISEAVLAHQGEADESRLNFEKLSVDDRAALIEFLNTFRTASSP